MDDFRPRGEAFQKAWDADTASVERFQAGDEEAFEALVRSREREVYRTALRMLGNPDDAMEASQDTFVRVFRSLKDFRNEASFKTWVLGICINVCRNRLASAGERLKRQSRGLTVEDRDEGDSSELPIPDRSPDPASRTLGRELREALDAALLAIAPEHREVIVLRDVQDLDYHEICAVLDCPEGTLKSRLSRARKALREALEGIWP